MQESNDSLEQLHWLVTGGEDEVQPFWGEEKEKKSLQERLNRFINQIDQ